MARTLLFTLLSFVIQLNAFADEPLQQCRQLYSQQDSQASFEMCLPLAEQGNGEASFILSDLYTQGIGDNQPDLQHALVWLVESAKQGHGPACYNLAALYERGEVVDQDYNLAYSWYEKGAERGHTDSQLKVGIMSLKGIGTETNVKKATAWLHKAAESGNQSAQVTLAVLLSVSDAEQSFDWYNRAADQGNSYAYSQLAEAHAEGKLGQPTDFKKALYLAQKSVILGRAGSQELVDRIREKINSSAPVELAATELVVSEIANPEASIVESVEAIETAEVVTTKTSVPETGTSEVAAVEVTLPESDTVEETAEKTATAGVIKVEKATPETVATVVTVLATEMSYEPQPLVVMQEQPPLSTRKLTEQSTVSNVAMMTGLSAMHKDKAWLMAQPSDHYVLQLAQLSSEASVMTYIKQMGLEGRANYYHAHTNAGRVYVVLYSESFSGFQAAKKTVRQSFSAELQKSVWYRSYQDLQTNYRAP